MLQVQHTVVLHETNLSMFALLSVDREEGNLAIVHRESVPGGGYRSVRVNRKYKTVNKKSYCQALVPSPVPLDPIPNPKQSQI